MKGACDTCIDACIHYVVYACTNACGIKACMCQCMWCLHELALHACAKALGASFEG